MPLVLIGVLLLAAKIAEWGPMAEWSWWLILSPFAAAVLWWQFADTSGWTKQREMDKMEKKKIKRREKALDALGLNTARDRQVNAARAEAARRANAAEAAKREQPQRPSASASAAPERRQPRL